MIGVPERTEAAPYYFTYIDRITGDDIVSRLEKQLEEASSFLARISEEKNPRHLGVGADARVFGTGCEPPGFGR